MTANFILSFFVLESISQNTTATDGMSSDERQSMLLDAW